MYFNNLLFNTPNIKYFILIYIALKLYKQYNQIIYPTKKKSEAFQHCKEESLYEQRFL